MKRVPAILLLALSWSWFATFTFAQSPQAFARCENAKAVGIWSEPEFLHLTAKAKCNEPLTVLQSLGVAVRMRTKKNKEGWVLNSHLSSAKTEKPKTGRGFWRSFGNGLAAGAAATGTANTAASVKLMLFGGDDHKTYLGCLNCSEYANDSISNSYGTHGSAYSSDSIFNHFSQFGSAYSTYSACNRYASDPPVIVDSSGNYYGRLTLNEYHAQIGIGRKYLGWLAAICEN